MATSPTYALAHMFLPNLLRVKSAGTLLGVIERKEKYFFDALWAQAHLTHVPTLVAAQRDGLRIGVVELPTPREPGEAYFAGIVAKVSDLAMSRYFTLEQEYVIALGATRTQLCERDGTRHTKHGEGSPITGNPEVDGAALIDAIVAQIARKPW